MTQLIFGIVRRALSVTATTGILLVMLVLTVLVASCENPATDETSSRNGNDMTLLTPHAFPVFAGSIWQYQIEKLVTDSSGPGNLNDPPEPMTGTITLRIASVSSDTGIATIEITGDTDLLHRNWEVFYLKASESQIQFAESETGHWVTTLETDIGEWEGEFVLVPHPDPDRLGVGPVTWESTTGNVPAGQFDIMRATTMTETDRYAFQDFGVDPSVGMVRSEYFRRTIDRSGNTRTTSIIIALTGYQIPLANGLVLEGGDL